MNFDEMIDNAKAEKEQQISMIPKVIEKKVAVIGCGSNVMGRMIELNKAIPHFDPKLYLYMRFGFKFYAGYGSKGNAASRSNSYNVSYEGNGTYEVSEAGPKAFVNGSYHVAVFGMIKEKSINNLQRYNELLREGENAIIKYYDAINSDNKQSFNTRLKTALYEKIDGLASQVRTECGVAPVETMERIYSVIRKACRTEKGKSITMAKSEFLGEASTGRSGGSDRKGGGFPVNLIMAAIILAVTLFLVYKLLM